MTRREEVLWEFLVGKPVTLWAWRDGVQHEPMFGVDMRHRIVFRFCMWLDKWVKP